MTEFKDRILLPEQIQYLVSITSVEDVDDLEDRIETLGIMSLTKSARQFCYFTGYDQEGNARMGTMNQNEQFYRNIITYLISCSPKRNELKNYILKFQKQIRMLKEEKGIVLQNKEQERSIHSPLPVSTFINIQNFHDNSVLKQIKQEKQK